MRKNALENQPRTSQELKVIQEQYSQLFSEKTLNLLAKKHGFIKRERKITASSFVHTLVFNQTDHKHLSLLDLKCDFFEAVSKKISREALHKHFTEEGVNFLKDVFSQLLTAHIVSQYETLFTSCFFNSINIKDSSKFKLPPSFFNSYPSCGGYGKDPGMMNIQYEFDILSGLWKQLEFTKGTRNDQTESKETLDQIVENSLNIRDLGYITVSYLKAVEKNKAYYLNRLPKIGVFRSVDGKYKELNWQKIDKKMRIQGLECFELEVHMGEEKLKTRMIITPVPEAVAEGRIRKAQKAGKRKQGYQLSKEYKLKARYNIFITNVPVEVLSTKQVIEAYKLRWQVELIFKTWKSNLNITQIKSMKKERMECQLIAKFIWILLNSKLFIIANNFLKNLDLQKGCSLMKFLKRAKTFSNTLKAKISNLQAFLNWFDESLIPIIPDLYVEQKGKKKTHCQSLLDLFYA